MTWARWLKPDRWSVLLTAFILLTAGLFFYEQPPPRESFGTDYVVPAKLRAGESFEVFRTFKVTRYQQVQITRALVTMNCTWCESIDLANNSVTSEVKDFVSLGKKHLVPVGTRPGVYYLRFTLHWQDHLGRTRSQALPPLYIEVVP